ncbi:MAG: tetratricopeptide repeat-containing sulfotransferase family protein [Rhodanobacteraceae bacterium]
MDRFAERIWVRAQRYIADGKITAARIALESLLRREPDKIAARMLLASVHLNEGRVREAATQATLASRSLPDDADAIANASQCLLRVGEITTARTCLSRYDALSRKLDGPHLRLLARTYQLMGDYAAALELMDRAQAQGYDNADFRYFHGLQLQFNGHVEAARDEMRECLRLIPTYGRAALALARLSKRSPDAQRLDFIRAQLNAVRLGTEEHAAFEFAQFEEMESLGRYDDAFATLSRGNAIMYRRMSGEARIDAGVVDEIKHLATRDFVIAPEARIDGPIPIFIVGMPRSGTTLLDRMLDNHPDVVSTGERNDFPLQLRWSANRHGNQAIDRDLIERMPGLDYMELGRRYLQQTQWRAAGKLFYVDKLPPNHLLIGFIHKALPQAPILHMVREPVAVCFSNYKALFGDSYPYSYDLTELAQYHALYRDLMRHWHEVVPDRLLDVSYRQLVTNPEKTLAGVFAHCGLRHVEGCSDLAKNASSVATLSSAQVRGPLHTRGLSEWQRYGIHLAALRKSLASSDSVEIE